MSILDGIKIDFVRKDLPERIRLTFRDKYIELEKTYNSVETATSGTIKFFKGYILNCPECISVLFASKDKHAFFYNKAREIFTMTPSIKCHKCSYWFFINRKIDKGEIE